MKKISLLLFAFIIVIGQPSVYAKETVLQEVLPGDDPVIIEFAEVNSYLADMEAYNSEISQKLNERGGLKDLYSILKDIEKYKKSFDNHVELLKKNILMINLQI